MTTARKRKSELAVVTGASWATALEAVARARDADKIPHKRRLAGIHFDPDGVIATDGHRLHLARVAEWPHIAIDAKAPWLPCVAWSAVDEGDARRTLAKAPSSSANGLPRTWRNVRAEKAETLLEVPVGALIAHLKRLAALLGNDLSGNRVTFAPSPPGYPSHWKAARGGQEVEATLTVPWQFGGTTERAFNLYYLLDALTALTLYHGKAVTAVLRSAPDDDYLPLEILAAGDDVCRPAFLALVMPLRR